MLEFLETGKALYVLVAVCALGLVGRLVTRSLYKRLMKETDNMTLTKNRYLRDLKQKTENTYRLNQGIRNSRVYLEKQLTTYRFLGMSLSAWTSFGGQMTILCFLLGGAASFGAYWYRCDSYYIVLYGSIGILAGLVTMLADYWANLSERKLQLLNSLQDYMENSLFNRLVRETAITAGEDIRRESAKASSSDWNRRNRAGKIVRAVINSSGAENPIENHGVQANKEVEDKDFIGKDLESLKKEEYGKVGELTEIETRSERMVRDGNQGRIKKERADESEGRRRGMSLHGTKKNQPIESIKEQEGGRRDEDYLKNSLEQIAASRERNQSDGEWIKDLPPDELELVGQILKQYLL